MGFALYKFWIDEISAKFAEFDRVGIDIETTGLSPIDSRMMMAQIGFPDDTQFVLDARVADLKPLLPYLKSRKWKKLFFNGRFDEQFFLYNFDTPILNVWDGYIHERILNPEAKGGQSFADAVKRHLDIDLDKTTQKSFIGGQVTPFTEKQIEYGALDVKYLFPLIDVQREKIAKIKQGHIADLENDLVTVVSNMELTGVPIDIDKWREVIGGYKVEHEESRLRLMEHLQKPITKLGVQEGMFDEGIALETTSINLGSPTQMKEAFAKIGIVVKDTSNETISVLPYASTKELTKYRGLDKLMTSYGESAILEKIHPFTGRIHADWQQIGTETGRFSCRKPNLQQVPPKLRACIGGEKDYELVGADFSQMELRILAQESKDPVLVDAFTTGKDIHTHTASTMFNLKPENVTKEQRFTAKTLNFGITYGMGLDKFVNTMNEEAQKSGTPEITLQQGQKLISLYKETYKVANAYLKQIGFSAVRHQMVETRYGRRRYFIMIPTGLTPEEYRVRIGAIKRAGANMPIQGTNADITKLAMIDIHNEIQEYGFKANIILQVHDEIVLLAHKSQVEAIKPIVVNAMVKWGQQILPDIPVVVEVYNSSYWPK